MKNVTAEALSILSDAKRGKGSPTELGALAKLATEEATIDGGASLARLALRIARMLGLDSSPINAILASLYSFAASTASDPALRVSMLLWAQRYHSKNSCPEQELHRLRTHLGSRIDPDDYLRALFQSSATFECGLHSGEMRVVEGACQLQTKIRRGVVPIGGAAFGGQAHGSVHGQFGSWKWWGYSTGKGSRAQNDDSLCAQLHSDGRVFCGVTDGTGDSEFGYRASRIAMDALVAAVLADIPSRLVLAFADSCLRLDNRLNCLDGACTAMFSVLDRSGDLFVGGCGDAFFVAVGADGSVSRSSISKQGRCVLGSEPLGSIITSSGNLVSRLAPPATFSTVEPRNPAALLLASDGLAAEGDEEIAEICTTDIRLPSEERIAALTRRAEKNGNADDVSFILIENA